MDYCPVANQISKHCDEDEAYCFCGSSMTVGDTAKTEFILFCDSDECDNQTDTEKELEGGKLLRSIF